MKRIIIFIITLSLIIFSCFGKDDNDFKKRLIGTWNPKIEENPISNVFVPNVSAVFYNIERTKNTQNIIVSANANAPFEIIYFNKKDKNIYVCHVTEDNENIYEIEINFLEKNIIKITKGNLFFDSDIYYKISRLDLRADKIFTPTVKKLSFRESPTLEGKYIRMLTLGDKVEILETGKTESIENVEGTWVKVKTEKGEIGWCFDAYLEEVKDDNVKKTE